VIVEQRTYDFRPGTVPRFLALYEDGARQLQQRILGNMIGYFVTEHGPLNQTVHMWGYESLDERLKRRAALLEEPDWRAFLDEVTPMIVRQESKILMPTAFSPIGGRSD